MAIVSSSSVGNANALFGVSQARLQQAKRNAEQAEAQAAALQAQAKDARRSADRAEEAARSVALESSQAQSSAQRARQGYGMLQTAGQMAASMANAADRVEEKRQASRATTSTKSVLNSQGQMTGRLVNTTA